VLFSDGESEDDVPESRIRLYKKKEPEFKPVTPDFEQNSPVYAPNSPSYIPNSPPYVRNSPPSSSSSSSPQYSPTSPPLPPASVPSSSETNEPIDTSSKSSILEIEPVIEEKKATESSETETPDSNRKIIIQKTDSTSDSTSSGIKKITL
jgi:hypothetical protein